MLDIQFTHTSSNGSSSKTFVFSLPPGSVVTEKVPPQAQHVIQLAFALSQTQTFFTYNELINFIDECCAYNNTTFTRSKGGTERIVRYYSKLLQNIGALTDASTIDSDDPS